MEIEIEYDQQVAEKVRGKTFLDATPLCNSEVILLLKERTDSLSKDRITVPSMVNNTLHDLTKIANAVNSVTNEGAVQKRKNNLESHVFDGDKGELRLDPAEVCQIINLNPMSEDDLISYIPTLKRFSGYQLSLFMNE